MTHLEIPNDLGHGLGGFRNTGVGPNRANPPSATVSDPTIPQPVSLNLPQKMARMARGVYLSRSGCGDPPHGWGGPHARGGSNEKEVPMNRKEARCAATTLSLIASVASATLLGIVAQPKVANAIEIIPSVR